MIIFVPGGAMGVVLKSNVLKIFAYADNIGFIIYVLNKCIVIPDCFTIQHHKSIGILLSADNKPPHKMILECAYSLFL